MRIPVELVAMVAVLAAIAIGCTWTIRGDCRRPDGTTDHWGIVEALLSMFFMLSMLAAAALQVIVRYLFSDDVDLPWTEEFGRLALVWAAFWGAAALQRADDHIRMTVLYDSLPAGAQWMLRVVGDLIVLAILVPLTWLGWETARGLDIMHTIALGVSLSLFAYPVPVAGFLMIVHTLGLLARRLTGREPPPAEPPVPGA